MHVMYLVHGRSGRWQHVSVSNVLHIAFVYNNWAVGESGLYKRRDMHTSGKLHVLRTYVIYIDFQV